jgi:hypothetical protein
MAEDKPVWDKEYDGESKPLSDKQKAAAKARAKRAGRSYPNMIDNIWAAQQNESNDPMYREALPRDRRQSRRGIDLVVRMVKDRRNSDKPYRQQVIQKNIIDETFDLEEKEQLYIPPASKSLNIARGHMPQIEYKNQADFVGFLKNKGYKVEKKRINPKKLRASQKNFNQEKIVGLMGKDLDKPIFVSKDNYVLDGHHRWLAAWNNGDDIVGLVIDANAMEVIELMREYPKSYTKNINESEPTLNKVVSSDRDDKKYMVRVKNEKGNIVTVHFGDPDMKIRTSNPEARKSFRARHGCDNPGPKTKARYWSCKLWSTDSVSDHL